MLRHAAALALALLTACPSFAQRAAVGIPGAPAEGNPLEITVHVLFANERPAGEHITVLLESPTGGTMTQATTDHDGKAMFKSIPPGLYRIRVRDFSIEETVTGILDLQYERTHHEYIRVQPSRANTAGDATPPAAPDPAALIPEKARKEFDKANRALAAGDREKAIEHFRRATDLYPRFAVAHNNLAALYIKSKDFARAHDALDQALKADPDLPLTNANLIRLAMLERNFTDATLRAEKALAKYPNSPEFLLLMCEAHFFSGKFDQALIYARRVYTTPHQNFELAHILAGRALEAQNRTQEAKLEYTGLLQESPSAPEAAEASKSLARLAGATKPQ